MEIIRFRLGPITLIRVVRIVITSKNIELFGTNSTNVLIVDQYIFYRISIFMKSTIPKGEHFINFHEVL